MQIWTEYSTVTVMPNSRPGKTSKAEIEIDAARNSWASAQVVIRDLAPLHVAAAGLKQTGGAPLPKGFRARIFREECVSFDDLTAYPDRLVRLRPGRQSIKIPAHRALGFFTDFFIPRKTPAGAYEFTFSVLPSGAGSPVTAKIRLNVHKAGIPDPVDALFGHEYFFNTALVPEKCGIKRFTEEWWDLLGKYADIMRELRNNVICVPYKELLLRSGSEKMPDGTYRFDWTVFDRFVKTFIDRGAAREFTLCAHIQSVEGKFIDAIGENGGSERFETLTDEAAAYIRTVYGAIGDHLVRCGWDNIFRAHIEDEPHTTEAWLWADNLIREAAPCLLTGEPLDMIESARVITETARWAVPRINVHDEDAEVFRKFTGKGGELWLYSCCFPEEAWWLNKFVDLPAIRSRLMEWACVGAGAKGFLHWGFNYWGDGRSLYGFNADARFKGDGAVVYPNVRRKFVDRSLRFVNTRDGLQDAELMMTILNSKDRRARNALGRLLSDSTGGCFTAFSDDPDLFNERYKKLLGIADGIS